MITFTQFLTEARTAPIYHATRLRNAEKILHDNILYGTLQDNGNMQGKKGIFFTRSLKHARNIYGGAEKVIFVIDQQKLNYRYKIKPIKNWDSMDRNHKPQWMTGYLGGNEFEEFVTANRIDNFDDYITKIYVASDIDKKQYPLLASDPRVEVLK